MTPILITSGSSMGCSVSKSVKLENTLSAAGSPHLQQEFNNDSNYMKKEQLNDRIIVRVE
jgi:hypothetical protein